MAHRSRGGASRGGTPRSLLIGLIVVLAVVALAGIWYYGTTTRDQVTGTAWSLDQASRLSFSHREHASPQSVLIEDTANFTLEKVSYRSYDTTVYGLLRIPKGVADPPVVIILPAATVTKEEDAPMATDLATFGYASFTLDERGNGGETLGRSPMDLQEGYRVYRAGGMPAQYAQVYDVLLACDYLQSREDLDGSSITVLGESMGGRFAIIAAAIEPDLKGAFVVSSGPYGVNAGSDREAVQFVDSIEPATYLAGLPPGKLVLFHFTGDPIIPVE